VKQFLANKCIALQCSNTPHSFNEFKPLWRLSVPRSEKCVERNSFSFCRRGEIEIANLLNRVSVNDLQHRSEQWKIRVHQCMDFESKLYFHTKPLIY
jgi:hypothetical protein